MTSKLSFVSLSIGALLMLSFIAITTTNAYAQPQGRGNNNSQACPDGFEKNRRVCQAEPELVCDEDNGFELIDDPGRGLTCYKMETAEPECVPPFPSSANNYWDNINDFRCESGQYPNGVASGILPDCNHLEGQGWRYGFLPGTDTPSCVRELFEDPTQQCDVGSLNEQTEMCEVRPGRT
jgi:hypothetical protein